MRGRLVALLRSGPRLAQSGQAALEFSLVILIFLGLLAAILEGARLATSYFALSDAARGGGRAGVSRRPADLPASTIDANVRTKVRQTLPAWITIPDADIVICRHVSSSAAITDACDSSGFKRGSVVDVTVQWTFGFLAFPSGWLGQTT